MTQKERMLAELPYKAWLDGLSEDRMENKKRIYAYNNLPPDARKEQDALIKEILGKTGETVHIEASFHCDYGYNIEVGENFFANYNFLVLDIMPGVTIGNNVVIGAGSVVTKDIPDNMIAAGNPCRIIREITEEDRDYYYKDRKFDVTDY